MMSNAQIADALQAIRPLNDTERLEAENAAKTLVIARLGGEPNAADYARATVSKYPAWVNNGVAQLILVVLLAASALSVFRQFTVGRDYFMYGQLQTGVMLVDGTPVQRSGINDHWQGVIAGVATPLLGEFLIILSTIAARVYFVGRARLWFIIPVLMGLMLTLVGNWMVEQPHDLFGLLVTVSPPIAVLFLSIVGERLIFTAIEDKHAADTLYQAALSAYRVKASNPLTMDGYRNAYGNALRAAVFGANLKGAGATARRELMGTFDNAIWQAIVRRESDSDNWLDAVTQPITAEPAAPITVTRPTPAALPAPLTVDDVGLPPARPPRKVKAKVDMSAAPVQRALF